MACTAHRTSTADEEQRTAGGRRRPSTTVHSPDGRLPGRKSSALGVSPSLAGSGRAEVCGRLSADVRQRPRRAARRAIASGSARRPAGGVVSFPPEAIWTLPRGARRTFAVFRRQSLLERLAVQHCATADSWYGWRTVAPLGIPPLSEGLGRESS